jgi:ubiquinone/menaquinone biosynthesis C-methylase UbiE
MSEYGSASVPMQREEIRQKYNQFASWYDLVEGLPELLGVRVLRRQLLQRAAGRVLEVAVGSGKNLRHYSTFCQLTAVDLSPAMLAVARRRTDDLELDVAFQVMDAERLAFADQCFDTVVDALTLCTYLDPVAALQEMARVCKPAGRLLLEHGRSDRAWLGRWQDRRAARHARRLGCQWNREPDALVHQAGLRLITAQRTFCGIFHAMESMPPRTGPADGRERTETRRQQHDGGTHEP